jgi:hypothetical protein
MAKDTEYVYDEKNGSYIENRKLTVMDIMSGKTNKIVYEKDLTLEQIDNYREKSNKTLLTNYDVGLLHKLSTMEFSTSIGIIDFIKIPLKDLYPSMSNDKLKIDTLLPIAKDFNDAMNRGERIVIERFLTEESIENNLQNILLIVLLFLIFIIMSVVIVFYRNT